MARRSRYGHYANSRGRNGSDAWSYSAVAALKPSPLRIRDEEGKIKVVFIGGGFMEMDGKKATFLLRSAEWPQSIDITRAEEAKRRAEERLAKADGSTDQERAEAALQRAITRLKIAQSNRE